MSEYKPGTKLYTLGVTVMVAVLLLLVAATGWLLIQQNGWSVSSRMITMALVLSLIVLTVLLTARGSQQVSPALTMTEPHSAPARPVHEAAFVHMGVRQPLGEVLDQLQV